MRNYSEINVHHILEPNGVTRFIIGSEDDYIRLCRSIDIQYEARCVLGFLAPGADPIDALLRQDYAIVTVHQLTSRYNVKLNDQSYRVEIQIANSSIEKSSPTLISIPSLLHFLEEKTGKVLLWKLNIYRLYQQNAPRVVYVHEGRGARFLKILLYTKSGVRSVEGVGQ